MKRLHIISGAAIVGSWVVTIGNGVIRGDWHGLDLTTPVMIIFAGYLFGDNLLRHRYADD